MATDIDRVDSTGLGILWNKMKQYVQQYVQQNSSGGGVSISSVYPIGSIYMSVNSTSPSTLFGGTWERIQDTFLLAAGSKYSAGGSGGSPHAVVVSHTHTQNEHAHTYAKGYNVWATQTGSTEPGAQISGSSKYYAATAIKDYKWLNSTNSARPTINRSGEDGTDKNMPPYLTVYMWKRTA